METALIERPATETGLSDLAASIDREHAAATAAANITVDHARRCGELLLQAKAKIGHGRFLSWLGANCVVTDRQARTYMKIAGNWPAIEAKRKRASDLSVRGALRLIDKRKPDDQRPVPGDGWTYTPLRDWSLEDRRWHFKTWWDLQAKHVVLLDAAGMAADEIAAYLGIDEDNDVLPILDPKPQIRGQHELTGRDNGPFTNLDAATFAEYVWHYIHCWLQLACERASWIAEYEGYASARGRLEHETAKHARLRSRLADPWRGNFTDSTAMMLVDCTAIDAARRAIGIETPGDKWIYDIVLPLWDAVERNKHIRAKQDEGQS